MNVMTMLTLTCLSFQTWRPAVNIKDIERSTNTGTPGPFNVMPFEQSPRGGIIVKVRVKGRGPFKWLLDTGSSHSAISAELANSLGVTPIADAVVESPIGESVRTIVELNRFEIGPTLTSQVLASVIPAEAATRMRGFQGLIGQDVLATKHYTIDYRGRRLLWFEQRAAAAGVFPLPALVAAGRCRAVRAGGGSSEHLDVAAPLTTDAFATR